MKIKLRIKQLRTKQEMSIQQLSIKSRVRYATVHKYENNPSSVDLNILADIAAALEVEKPDELFSFEDTDD